ncbi:MAG: sulfite exporter TauE/SafE family protein, partial [Deltaproteobacteria bacterium]|nr:sulfite exporter TauE/SafE family protein [Deltaproteobacteria bacterium]
MLGPELIVAGAPVSVLGLVALGTGVGYAAGLFGVGGGFIMTPLLVALFGVPLSVAVGTGLCQIVGTSLVSALRQRRAGKVEVRLVAALLPPAMLGSELGARALEGLSALGSVSIAGRSILWSSVVGELAYVVLLVGIGVSYVRGARAPSDELGYLRPGPLTRIALGPPLDLPAAGLRGVSTLVLAGVGLGFGTLSGLLGIGGGVVLSPILIYGLGFPVQLAIGTGVSVLFATSIVGTVAHALRGNVHLALAVTLLIGGTVAAQLGALASRRFSGATLARLQAAL